MIKVDCMFNFPSSLLGKRLKMSKNQTKNTYSLLRSYCGAKPALLFFTVLQVVVLYLYQEWYGHDMYPDTLNAAYLILPASALLFDRYWSYLIAIIFCGNELYQMVPWVSGYHRDAMGINDGGSPNWNNMAHWC